MTKDPATGESGVFTRQHPPSALCPLCALPPRGPHSALELHLGRRTHLPLAPAPLGIISGLRGQRASGSWSLCSQHPEATVKLPKAGAQHRRTVDTASLSRPLTGPRASVSPSEGGEGRGAPGGGTAGLRNQGFLVL